MQRLQIGDCVTIRKPNKAGVWFTFEGVITSVRLLPDVAYRVSLTDEKLQALAVWIEPQYLQKRKVVL